jgi:hypothetical protein
MNRWSAGQADSCTSGLLKDSGSSVLTTVRILFRCREEALELSSKKAELDALGVDLVAVVHETLGAEEFKSTSFPNAPLYLDTSKAFFKFLGAGSLIWADPSDLTSPEAKKHGDRARAKKVKGNMKGEGRILGGLVVASANGVICGVLFPANLRIR